LKACGSGINGVSAKAGNISQRSSMASAANTYAGEKKYGLENISLRNINVAAAICSNINVSMCVAY